MVMVGGRCRCLSTPRICNRASTVPLPKNLHERVEDMMARSGLTRWKAAEAVTEESWPETKAEFERMLQERDPVLDRECVIERHVFDDAIRVGEVMAAVPQLEHPDVVDGVSTRILGKSSRRGVH